MTANHGQMILLVSDDAALCAAARRELEAKDEGRRVAAVSTVEAARRIIVDAAPAVILMEDTAVTLGPEEKAGRVPCLESAVAALAAYAPVVVIGGAHHEVELTALVAEGVADFVARAGGSLTVAPRVGRAAVAPSQVRTGRSAVKVPRRRGEWGSLWRSSPPRAEQSADGNSGQCGTAARGSAEEERRPTAERRAAAAGNHRRPGGAFAGNRAAAEPGLGSAPSSRETEGGAAEGGAAQGCAVEPVFYS